MEATVSQATILAGILLTNLGAIVGFFVAIKVAVAKLEVKVDHLEKDINNIAYYVGTPRAKGERGESGNS